MRKESISDEVIGAYVDGELSPAGVAQLDERLASDRELRARVEAQRRVTDLVRAAAVTPADARPDAAALRRTARDAHAQRAATTSPVRGPRAGTRRRLPRPVAWGIAASVVAALAGALLTALLTGHEVDTDDWQQHALAYHESYLAALDAQRMPLLDARASDPAALGQSLAALVDDEQVVVPDLTEQGYLLQGARVIETDAGPITYVVYAGANKPLLGLAVLPSTPEDDFAQHLHQHGDIKLLEWSDGEHRFGVGGTHSAASLRLLADAVQDFAAGSDEPDVVEPSI